MRRPEILAPAGDRDALAAALAAGADAVYFGLDDGFNARARAENFSSTALREVVEWIHRAGARAYVTMNTLVFEPELPIVEQLLQRVATAGVDAIIVQDPAVALIAREVCPQLEVHASTQMTASSPLAVGLLQELGLRRVVVPRELSIDEIRAYRAGISADDHGSSAGTPMTRGVELEVFVHGALCVAWSGQCLSSEAWGGRSANRGQCAQACRLPYRLVVDNVEKDLGDVEYLLSPKDLVGLDAIDALAEIGVASLKIEGRLKGPAYVATAVAQYRRAAGDAVGEPPLDLPVDIPLDPESLHVAYSRGISAGFLNGADHQTLVEGRFPRHRGLPLGRVIDVDREWVSVVEDHDQRPVTGGRASDSRAPDSRASDSRASDSRASDSRAPDSRASDSRAPDSRASDSRASDSRASDSRASDSRASDSRAPDSRASDSRASDSRASDSRASDNGGRISDVRAGMGVVFDRGEPEKPEQGGPIFGVERTLSGYRLRFGDPGPDLANVRVGDFVWVSSDPKVTRAGDKATEAGRHALGRIAIELRVSGKAGEPLEVLAIAKGCEVSARSTATLHAARGAGITHDLLAEKLGALGGTSFHVGAIDTTQLDPALHVPVSELKEIRRALVAELDLAIIEVRREVTKHSVIDAVRARMSTTPEASSQPLVVPLCRDDAQLDAVLDAGATAVELDWMELVGLSRAVDRAKQRGARVTIATIRVQKPGEERIDAHLARLAPTAILVRSWGSLAYFKPAGLELHGDFSLNVTNSITAGWVLGHGLQTITAAHDLDRDQLFALLEATPRGRVAVTVHHHIPTFHTEHCVYAHLLSTGKDFRDCGRPCEQHRVALKDRVGLVHPVIVDVGCRNTVFNAQAQSAASLIPDLLSRGVSRFRIELVRETADQARRLFTAYKQLVAGVITPAEVLRAAEVHEQFGVTRGTMRTLTVLR